MYILYILFILAGINSLLTLMLNHIWKKYIQLVLICSM